MIRRLKVLGLALLAVFAVGVVVAGTASALPKLSPEGNRSSGSNVGTTETVFVTTGGREVKCTGARSEQQENAQALGPFHIRFTGCNVSNVKCTGLGDSTTGEILLLGTYHFVYDTKGEGTETLGVAILFLLGEVHFECLSGLILIKVSGTELCLVSNPYVLKTLIEFHCTQSRGIPNDKSYLNDGGTSVATGLTNVEQEKNSVGAAEEASGLILVENSEGRSLDVLILMS